MFSLLPIIGLSVGVRFVVRPLVRCRVVGVLLRGGSRASRRWESIVVHMPALRLHGARSLMREAARRPLRTGGSAKVA